MKVAFLVINAGMGGHARSARAIARAVRENGCDVRIVVAGSTSGVFSDIDMDGGLLLPQRLRAVEWDAEAVSRICEWVRRSGIEIIHTFDEHSALVAYWVKRRLGIPVVSTICGGKLRFRYPFTRPVVVFSEELRDALVERYVFDANQIVVEPGRIDFSRTDKLYTREEVRRTLEINPQAEVLIHVTRIDLSRAKSVNFVLEVIGLLATMRPSLVYVLIGSSQDPRCEHDLLSAMARLNSVHGRTVCIWDRSIFVREAAEAMAVGDIFLGVGRGCYEAMDQHLPVCVLGVDGFAGLVERDGCVPVDELQYFNFSGRNCIGKDRALMVSEMAEGILALLSSGTRLSAAAEYGFEWVRENLDVHRSGATYPSVYQALLGSVEDQQCDSAWVLVPVYWRLWGGAVRAWMRRLLS